MRNNQNYIVCIWWFIHTHIFCSYQYTKVTQLFLFTSWPLHILPTLSKRKRNYGFPYLSLSFNIITFSINDWLIQGSNISKKEYKRVTWLFMFLRTPLLCLKWVLVPTKYVVSEGCQLPYLLSHRCNMLILYLFWISLNSHTSWVHWNSMLMGIMNANNWQDMGWTCILCISPLLMFMTPCPTGFHL